MGKAKGSMFWAGLFGAALGAVGGLLLAPQSGRKTREKISSLAKELGKKVSTESKETKGRIKDVFGKVTDEATQKYNEVKNSVIGKVAQVKTAGEKIDKEKYIEVVDGVVSDFRSDLEGAKASVTKIATYLKKDWEKVKKALA